MIKNLIGKQLLFFDGAMATQLQIAGLKTNDIPDLWNISHPNIIKNVHEQYLAAGCDIIKTNTFGCNVLNLEGTGYTVEQIAASAVANAKAAVELFNDKPRFIALSIGPTGKLLKPLGDLDFEDAVNIFKQTISIGVKAGVDLILIETMSCTYELKAAVLAAKACCNLPIFASVTLNEKGRLLTGGGIDAVAALLEGLGVDVIGFNCGFGHEQLAGYITQVLKISSLPILFMPNAGLPEIVNGVTQYNTIPEDFAFVLKKSVQEGVWLLGGCCGTTPAHIKTLIKKCAGISPPSITQKKLTVAASYGRTVVFDEAQGSPVIIGERINPTGKPKFRQALKNGDYDYVLQEGITQTEQGAGILDVNVGVPGIDEAAVLQTLVEKLQGIIDLPLQIDTANFDAMEKAMRIYNGKPVVNSVNGKTSSMNAVFPLVKKYGAVIVALTLDENGIPETAQGRIDIAEKIIKNAEQYGIGKENFLFDPLTMAVSAKQDNALITLECVRRLKEMGVKTTLGVSNISFGLPDREFLNNAFLSLALEAGLTAAIINPKTYAPDQEINNDAINALLGKDDQFKVYIDKYGQKEEEAFINKAEEKKNDNSLFEIVLKGLKQQAADSAKKSLEKTPPLEVIENELIPAINAVGQRFEKGTIYLPQLLMSAEAAKNAFAVIRKVMGSAADDTIGTIILATVEGDIHDIGKNIVKAMLENYRFKIIDLGIDVPSYKIVEAAIEHNVKLVGLSALMTTTVVYMEKTIKALREAGVDCKIMCGGAVLTKDYADRIGADSYVKDAMASVRYAQEIYKKK